ncbi:MAG: hypothetical protein NT010_05410 [Proteobacteria bacterium]|nr:hypothetical protein [Pseudomonadota bacterium]
MQDLPVISTIIQGFATIVLVFVTWRYVNLTKKLVELQVEPRIDLLIPEDILHDPTRSAKLVNNSGCDVDTIHMQVSAIYRHTDGTPSPIMRCIDTRTWNQKLKPKTSLQCDIARYFAIATEIGAETEIPEGLELVRRSILLSVSFKRSVDGKEFCFEEPYSVIAHENGTATVSRTGFRRSVDTLDKTIMKIKKV